MAIAMEQAKPTLGSVWRNGLIAAVAAAVVNAVLYFIGSALGFFPQDVIIPSAGQPLSVVPVISLSIIGVLAGTIFYSVLSRFVARRTANRVFTIVAIVVLLLMVVTPFTIPGAPAGMNVMLQLTHLVAGGAAIYGLTRA